jgi:hypothetical protein
MPALTVRKPIHPPETGIPARLPVAGHVHDREENRMQIKLSRILHLQREPAGICFADTTAVCGMEQVNDNETAEFTAEEIAYEIT